MNVDFVVFDLGWYIRFDKIVEFEMFCNCYC